MTLRNAGILLLVIVWTVACSWLAGAIFLSMISKRLTTATPWTIYYFMIHYGHSAKIEKLIFLSCLIAGSLYIALPAFLFRRRPLSPFGDARWATESDIQKAGLRAQNGLLLGRERNRFIVADGMEHVLCFAPTRSGKGVGIVIPNLLNWPGSAIVHDIKGENFTATSGFRSRHGQKVYFWNPGDPAGLTHCYNPLQFISSQPGQRIDDIQKIAHLILPDHEFWTNEARTLFVGLSLYLIETSTLTFGLLLRTVRGQGNFVDYIKKIVESERDKMNPTAYLALNAFAQKADKEQSAVLSTLNAAVELWANPLIDAATSRSDFDLRSVKKERMTIYVGVSPNNLHRLRPLMQVFYQQAIDLMTEKQPNMAEEPHPVLFLMDEFASLGRMTQFEQGIAYLAGYRVRLLLIIQDIPQLETHYQRSGMAIFMGNSRIRIAFAANNYETAELISRLLGTSGIETESQSHSRPLGFSLEPGHKSVSTSKMARPLLLPQEILQLSKDEEIIMVESAPPVRARKIRYFKDRVFVSRIHPAVSNTKVDPIVTRIAVLENTEPPTEDELDKYMDSDGEEIQVEVASQKSKKQEG